MAQSGHNSPTFGLHANHCAGAGAGLFVAVGAQAMSWAAPATARHTSDPVAGLGDWLGGRLAPRAHRRIAHTVAADGLAVLLDGYITAVTAGIAGDPRALGTGEQVASLYRRHGIDTPRYLRGSFNCLVVDPANSRALLFNDVYATRPLLLWQGTERDLLAAPDLDSLLDLLPRSARRLDAVALIESLVGAHCYSDRTLLSDLRRLRPAHVVEIDPGGIRQHRYWRLQFAGSERVTDETELLDQYDALLRQAARRAIGVMDRPFLKLSGGMDSRLMLASLEAEGCRDVPLIAYGVHDGPGTDLAVARQIAHGLGLPLQEYPMRVEDFVHFAERAVNDSDGIVELIDLPQRLPMDEQLARSYAMCLVGDEPMARNAVIGSFAQVMPSLSDFALGDSPRLEDWLNRSARVAIAAGIAADLEAALASVHEVDPNDARRVLFLEHRYFGMRQYRSSQRRHYESLSPLMDEDLLAFVTRIPVAWVENKKVISRLLVQRYSKHASFPLATRDSIPTMSDYRECLRRSGAMLALLLDAVDTGLHPSLCELFDRTRIRACLVALAQGQPLPPVGEPLARRLYRRVAGGAAPVNRVDTTALLLRLTQASLFLRHRL